MAKKLIENLMKEMLPLQLKAEDGSLYVKYVPRGGSCIIDESEMLPDTYHKETMKRLRIKNLA